MASWEQGPRLGTHSCREIGPSVARLRQTGGALAPMARFAGIEVCCVFTQAQMGLFVQFSLADFLPER